MASTANVNMKVVWADEIRVASRLMREWHDCDGTDEERASKMAAAFNAALVALWGIDDEAIVMLGAKDIQRLTHDAPTIELDADPRK